MAFSVKKEQVYASLHVYLFTNVSIYAQNHAGLNKSTACRENVT